MQKVYIRHHPNHAGKWIYKGYYSAWEKLGYNVKYYDRFSDISGEDYYLLCVDSDLTHDAFEYFEKSKKTFLFVRPTFFPKHWGHHENFCFNKSHDLITRVNELDNIVKWTYCETDNNQYFSKWGDVKTVPLAYDNINYKKEDKKMEFDVCFVGGWANNGFDEKRKIMISWMRPFMNSDLKCGFFINRGVSHEFESALIANSKVAINIHDAYQQELGLDTNERTFKSLGLNGLLVSDSINQIKKYFPDVPVTDTPEKMLNTVLNYVKMEENDRSRIRQKNIDFISQNHTYVNRVEQLLSF
jgi:hypothetical protein